MFLFIFILELSPILPEDKVKEIAQNFSSGKFDLISKLITNDILIQFKDDIYSQQILLSILIFSLLKLNQIDEVNKLYSTYTFPEKKMIFPLIFLKGKTYSLQEKEIPLALGVYYEELNLLESYNIEKDKEDKENIITIETFNSHFEILQNFFYYLYAMNNIDSKIKKLYFEIKNLLYNLGFELKSFEIISKLQKKYPNDLIIQFELAKDSLLVSQLPIYESMLNLMKEGKEKADENLKPIYSNYINYLEVLLLTVKRQFDQAKNKLNEIKGEDNSNFILMNNIAVIDVYRNEPKESYKNLSLIAEQNNYCIQPLKTNSDILNSMFNMKKLNLK